MKKCFLAVVAFCMIAMQTVTFSAVTESATDVESLQQQAESNKTQIDEKKNENQQLEAQIRELNTEIEANKLEIANLQKSIEESNGIIKDLDSEITQSKEALKKRIRAIYMAGNASNLEVILGAKSFDDFIDKVEYVSIIAEHDTALIDSLTQNVNTSKQAQKVLVNSKSNLENKSKTLQEQKTEFQKILQENQAILNVLYSENETISGLLSAEEDKNTSNDIESYYEKHNINKKPTEVPTEKPTAKPTAKPTTKPTTKPNSGNNKPSATKPVATSKPTVAPTQPPQGSGDNSIGNGDTSIVKGYTWPVPGFYHLTSLWNEDRYTYNHGAIDIASGGIDGANVVAAHSGTVYYAENNCIHNWGKSSSCGCGGGYGNWVMLDHGDGYMTVYAHLSSVTVSSGDTVEEGQLLGFVGSTGESTGAHLHFETRYDNVKYNPMSEYPNIAYTY
ncbi:MAG: peptidoglycan DD-metalloendopeptidase family protein [Acutalibacteraceae bacterium]